MKQDDDYVPIDLWREAKSLFENLEMDVELYKKIRAFPDFKQDIEADKFIAWWELDEFDNYPHALYILLENVDKIDETIASYNFVDAFDQLKMKMILFYRLLKEKGMIHD